MAVARLRDVPTIVVELQLEGAVHARIIASRDVDACRLGRWLEQRETQVVAEFVSALREAIDAAQGDCVQLREAA